MSEFSGLAPRPPPNACHPPQPRDAQTTTRQTYQPLESTAIVTITAIITTTILANACAAMAIKLATIALPWHDTIASTIITPTS